MKASLKKIAILLGCAVAAALFASCSKLPADEVDLPARAAAEYSVTVNDEMLEALVVSVEYYDGDGSRKTEILTGSWTKRVEAHLPATIGARLLFTVKEGFDPSESETIRLAYGVNIAGSSSTAKGIKIGDDFSYSNSSAKTIKTARLAEWVSRYAEDGVFSALFLISPDAKADRISWE